MFIYKHNKILHEYTCMIDKFGLITEEQRHLKNFYAIVPPLIINFVEHMLAAKDKLVKGKRQGARLDDHH